MWNPFKKKPATIRRRGRATSRGMGARVVTSMGDIGLTGPVDETFKADNRPIEQVIASQLSNERGKMRMLEHGNDYMGRYLTCLEENVVGSNGFRFQSRVTRANGKLNKPVNDKVEDWWRTQGKAANYTVAGESSLIDETAADKLILRSVARDGFCLIELISGVPNETGFGIHILPGELVNHELCENHEGRNRISNGVEIDRWGRIVAFHLVEGDNNSRKKAKRVPADNIIIPFLRTHSGQYLGLPWPRTVMDTLHGLDKFEEAVLTTAREAACKGLFYEQDPENPLGDFNEDDLSEDIYPGMHQLLPPGVKARAYDPSQPTDTYESYRRGVLMRAASGLNVSYQSLSGDLSGGNFASQRVGLIDEREIWKGRQNWFVNAVKRPIFEAALRVGRLTMGELNGLTIQQLNRPNFRGRRWDWVDPEKDLKAAKLSLSLGLTTREKLISDTDSDLDEEDTLKEISRSLDLEEENEISFAGEVPTRPGKEPVQPEADAEDEEPKDEEESTPENDEQKKEAIANQ